MIFENRFCVWSWILIEVVLQILWVVWTLECKKKKFKTIFFVVFQISKNSKIQLQVNYMFGIDEFYRILWPNLNFGKK